MPSTEWPVWHVCGMAEDPNKGIPSHHLEESNVARHSLTCSRDGLSNPQRFMKWLLLYASLCSGRSPDVNPDGHVAALVD